MVFSIYIPCYVVTLLMHNECSLLFSDVTVAKYLKVIVPLLFLFFSQFHKDLLEACCVTDTRPYPKGESENETRQLTNSWEKDP